MAAIEASEARGRRVDRGQRGRALARRRQRTELDRHLRRRGGRRRDPGPVGGAGPQDQAPRRLPRLPLAPDGADARGVRRGLRLADLQRAQDPDRLQPHRRDARRRAGHRPRLLGPPREGGGALRRHRRDPPVPGRHHLSWSSAPTPSSARWRRRRSAPRPRPPSSRPCARAREEQGAIVVRPRRRPRRRRQARLGQPSSRAPAPSGSRCRPTPSSASATGSPRRRRRRRRRDRPGRPPSTRCSAPRSRTPAARA